MEKHELKFASGEKSIRSVNLDLGVVGQTKKLYHGNLSHHIEVLLDQWCQDQDESNKVYQIVQDTMEDLKKAGSPMPEEDAIKELLKISDERKKELLQISDEERKALLETPSAIKLRQEMEADIPTPTKEQREHTKKVLAEMRKRLNLSKTKEGGNS